MSPRGKSLLVRAAERTGRVYGHHPSAFDPATVAHILPVIQALIGPDRYFDLDVRGWDNIPAGPVLFVSNHSGGTTALDGFGFVTAWYGHFGPGRPLHGLAHEVVFASHTTGALMERCGLLRARRDLAEEVVAMGRDVMVMPGGDQDVWRPARDRFRVRFAGRLGYARTALALGVPIVPVAHVGAHHTLHVLTDGAGFARRVRVIHAIARAEVFPISLALPWGLAVGPWPHLPPPTRLSYRIGAPLPTAGRDPHDDDVVQGVDRLVRARIQSMLDAMRRERLPLTSPQHLAHRALAGARSVAEFSRLLREAGPLPPAGHAQVS